MNDLGGKMKMIGNDWKLKNPNSFLDFKQAEASFYAFLSILLIIISCFMAYKRHITHIDGL